MKGYQLAKFAILTISLVCFFPGAVMAYIGPGAGLTAIGAFLAIILGIIVAVFGFVWYPVRQFIKKWKRSSHNR